MPRVGGKHFPYTPAGEAAAASEAARTASALLRDSYRHGGSIDMYGEGGKVKKKRKKPKPDPKRIGSAKPKVIANVAKSNIDGKSRVKTRTKYC